MTESEIDPKIEPATFRLEGEHYYRLTKNNKCKKASFKDSRRQSPKYQKHVFRTTYGLASKIEVYSAN